MDNYQTEYGKDVQAVVRRARGDIQDENITPTQNHPNFPFSQPARTSKSWQDQYGRQGANGYHQNRLYGYEADQQADLGYRPCIPHQQTICRSNRAPEPGERPNVVPAQFNMRQEPYQSLFDPPLDEFTYSNPEDHLDEFTYSNPEDHLDEFTYSNPEDHLDEFRYSNPEDHLDEFTHSNPEDHLDEYDRRLLPEPPVRPAQSSGSLRLRSQRAYSTQQTAQHTSVELNPCRDIFRPLQSPHFQSVSHSALGSQERFFSSFHNPPTPTISTFSSPVTLPSSPSFNVSQRRAILEKRRAGPKIAQARSLDLSHATENGRANPHTIDLCHAPPMVQGIQLISLNGLPDRIRSIFPFQVFNAMQSKCYATVYLSDDNLVVSAPTGGGKTAILELSICRLISNCRSEQYKIIYMAPTKSLCSERQRDWSSRFASLDLKCVELTGDTGQAQIRNVQNASIIITTPEKWDSITRKWKDHGRLMELVKLFLIDEVHILKDNRGATLEAVVSRMKSVGSNLRFIALSATVPNSIDVAKWLGRSPLNQDIPAHEERFGEEFRPVKLQKSVYGLQYRGNDFGFEGACDLKLPEIISKYSQKKPMMIFCITRTSTVTTAKLLANLWATKSARDRPWPGPRRKIVTNDPELRNTLTSGVAFHHAGLDASDRHAVEKGFLEGEIFVICCTSTLAVGVNLPCHMVIIKNTVSYQDTGLKEYADLEIMQMLGRAGRPQFDHTAIAVIITKQEKVQKYEKLVAGEEMLESCLHLNLVDHLNAEIGLGTIHDVDSAKRWLAGTFLFVRLTQKPGYYNLGVNDVPHQSLNDRIERICQRDVDLLLDKQLICSNGGLKSTGFGDAMTRYYVRFQTMLGLMSLTRQCKISEILSVLADAEEFHEIRFRPGEKPLFKEINKASGIKFPIKVDLAKSAHKCNLIMQAELGGVEYPTDEQYTKHKRQFYQDRDIIFANVNRLIKCIIDCKIHLQDGIAVRHALELMRSLGARVWDSSPYQLKQIPQIGPVAIRKLVMGGINSIEALEFTETERIEILLSKNPPFGNKILGALKNFPKLRITVKMMGKEVKPGQPVIVKIKTTCGFLNERAPIFYNKKALFVCLLVERSDGHLIEFRRMSARKLNNAQDIPICAEMTDHTQHVTFYIMCDEIAGTMRSAELKPCLTASLFPTSLPEQPPGTQSETAKRNKMGSTPVQVKAEQPISLDEFIDSEIDDDDLIEAVDDVDFKHIGDLDSNPTPPIRQSKFHSVIKDRIDADEWVPKKLKNGKWECNHRCKDKKACKHLCCREGVDKAPKAPKNRRVSLASSGQSGDHRCSLAPKLKAASNPKPKIDKCTKSDRRGGIETVDLSQDGDMDGFIKNGSCEYGKLHRLHESVCKGSSALTMPCSRIIPSFKRSEHFQAPPQLCNAEGSQVRTECSSDYEWNCMDEFPSSFELLGRGKNGAEALNKLKPSQASDMLALEEVFSDKELEASRSDISANRSLKHKKAASVQSSVTDLHQNEIQEEEQALALTASFTNQLSPLKSESSLFCSATSPNEVTMPSTKRKIIDLSETESSIQGGPLTKKPKVTTHLIEQIPETPAVDENEASKAVGAPRQIIQRTGRPRPEWVNEFDPEFIAEFADVVEFI